MISPLTEWKSLIAQVMPSKGLVGAPFTYKRPLRNVLVFGFSRLGRHCLVRCAASGRMSGVFLGSGSFGCVVCVGGYFNLVCGFEEVLADCSHGELGVSFCLPKVSGAVQAKKPFHRAKALLHPEASF